MTRFLRSEKRPEGHKLEDLLMDIRADMIHRCELIASDHRAEALYVMRNNLRILNLLSEAIELSMDSTRLLDRSFGPSQAAQGGPPRIGRPEADAA